MAVSYAVISGRSQSSRPRQGGVGTWAGPPGVWLPDDNDCSLPGRYDAAMSPAAKEGPPRLELRPLRGLRYVESAVSSLWNVTSPPVDLLEPDAIRALKHGDPHNIVRLIWPRGSRGYLRPRGGSAEYAGVEQRIQKWRQAGVLAR